MVIVRSVVLSRGSAGCGGADVLGGSASKAAAGALSPAAGLSAAGWMNLGTERGNSFASANCGGTSEQHRGARATSPAPADDQQASPATSASDDARK